jgi:hypothetical protein
MYTEDSEDMEAAREQAKKEERKEQQKEANKNNRNNNQWWDDTHWTGGGKGKKGKGKGKGKKGKGGKGSGGKTGGWGPYNDHNASTRPEPKRDADQYVCKWCWENGHQKTSKGHRSSHCYGRQAAEGSADGKQKIVFR